MKDCKWIVYLILLLLYAFIVFRYIQKRPVVADEVKITHTPGEEIALPALPLAEEEVKD